jgi:nicotinamidase-related amidase
MYDVSDSTLLIVDMQARLVPAIEDGAGVTERVFKLASAAQLLQVPVLATEHNVQALGATVDGLRGLIRATFQKMHFSAAAEPGFNSWLPNARNTIFVAGCEAHVCVLQTVMGLQAAGRRAVLVADACGSRRSADREAGLQRARAHGIDVLTVEMALFEWMGTCEHPQFRDVLRIVK